MWRVGKLDEEYINKMEDVLKTYETPLSENEPVICVDEKLVPMQPGRSHDAIMSTSVAVRPMS
jgi:hypothetical protein